MQYKTNLADMIMSAYDNENISNEVFEYLDWLFLIELEK